MGYLLQAKITTALLVKSISESENQFMYVDGFPRNEENYQAWFQNLDQYDHNQSINFGILILLRLILKKLFIIGILIWRCIALKTICCLKENQD